jgi:hypothetical protein
MVVDDRRNKVIAQNVTDELGGNNLKIHDPSCPPYTPFYVFINGHVQSGSMDNLDGVSCKFKFCSG